MRPFLLFLLAGCAGDPDDTETDAQSVVLASPPSTPEIGELSEYDAILLGGVPERVEWFFDDDRVAFGPVDGDRATLIWPAPAASFTVRVEAFFGIESVSDSLAMEAVPNTAPVVAIAAPTATALTAGELVSLVGEVTDRTEPPLACAWAISGADLRTGEADANGQFTAAWQAVAGSWTLELSCTDKLGLAAEASLAVVVQ